MKLIAEFLRKLNLVEYIEEIFTPLNPKSNRGYAPASIVLSFIVSILLGAKNISHTILLNFDEPIKKLFGLEEVPSISTFSRFFRKFKQKTIEEIFLRLNTYLLNLRIKDKLFDGVTIDLDSSVFERYGEQEGAEVGYNPKKHGRPSHHPIFAIISDIKFIIHLWLRKGNTSASSGAIEFLKEVIGRLPDNVKIKLIRCDSGFFGGKFLNTFSKFYATEAAIWMVAIVWNLLIYFKKEILCKEDIRLMKERIKMILDKFSGEIL